MLKKKLIQKQRFYATNGLQNTLNFKLDAKAPGSFEVTKIYQPIPTPIAEGMIETETPIAEGMIEELKKLDI